MKTSNNHFINFKELKDDINDFLYSYIKVQSFSNSAGENDLQKFFQSKLAEIPYFQNNPQHYGLYPVPDDHLNRKVCYAMVKGEGDNTVVMVHHYDVVTIEDFKNMKELAFSPDELKKALLKIKDSLQIDVQKDLADGTFMFGRGCADMKGGGSIQYCLMKQYSKLSDFKGNIVVIGVPDEENLSAGMRGAVSLLCDLKKEYNLNYKFMINSEPHQRKDFDTGVISRGSIGKMMPFFYVRGFLAHCGKSFEGLNPVNILSEIVRRTEGNMYLSDTTMGECSPGATWLYMKDSKTTYDVSMPLSASGCLSVLTLTQTPEELLSKIRSICIDAFDSVIDEMNRSYEIFLKNTGRPISKLPWKSKTVTFSELYAEAESLHGKEFTQKYEQTLSELGNKMNDGTISVIECNFKLLELIFDYIDDTAPCIVYGLIPPYYPSVSNISYEERDSKVKDLFELLNDFSKEEFNMPYTKEYFYTGISDLSYIQIENPTSVRKAVEESMPLFGKAYDIPFEQIHDISMPCINIGPWGKDFHKMTERVNLEDLLVRTPRLIDFAVKEIISE